MAIRFDADNERVEIPAHSSIDDLSSMTVMVWYRAVDVSSVGVTIAKHSDAGADGWTLFRPQFAVGPNDWWYVKNRTTTDTQVQSNGNYIQANRWEWVCVMDSDGVAPDMLVGPVFGATVTPTYGTRTTGSGSTAGDSDRDVWIGDSPDFSQPAQQEIAVVQMFDRRLGIAEAATFKQRPRPASGCVLFAQLGFHGLTAVDWSGYQNHGTVFNGTIAQHVPLDMRLNRRVWFVAAPAATPVDLAGVAAGMSVAAADLWVEKLLAGVAGGTSTASGEVVVEKPLAGSAAGMSVAAADLWVEKPLVSGSAGTSTASGEVVVEKLLAGGSAGTSTAGGEAVVEKPLAGVAAGTSMASGDLQAEKVADLAGSAAGTSTAAADLFVEKLLAGQAIGVATAAGTLWVEKPLAAVASGASVASGNLQVVAASAYTSQGTVRGAAGVGGVFGVSGVGLIRGPGSMGRIQGE